MSTVEHLIERFQVFFARAPEIYGRAPGRVALVGCGSMCDGGAVVTVAINRGVRLLASKRRHRRVLAYSTNAGEFHLARLGEPLTQSGFALWHDCVRSAIHVMVGRGMVVPGLDLLVSSDLPEGVGLASAAALTVAALRLLLQASGAQMTARELAELAAEARLGGPARAQAGCVDELAVTCSEADMATLIDCRSLEVEQLPVPFGAAVVVIVNTGVTPQAVSAGAGAGHEGSGGALALIREAEGMPYPSLCQVPAPVLERHTAAMPDTLRRRVNHIVAEQVRVAAFAEALRAGDMAAAGAAMGESHASLRDNLGVSCPELELIVETAGRTPGVHGCRMAGTPFGGCAVALVKPTAAAAFAGDVIRDFSERFGRRPEVYATHPTRGAVARPAASPSDSGFHAAMDMPTT
jgi:galactokinase